jgi:hypothetical protein
MTSVPLDLQPNANSTSFQVAVQSQDSATGVAAPLNIATAVDRTPSEWLTWEVRVAPPTVSFLIAMVPDVRVLCLTNITPGVDSDCIISWQSTTAPLNTSLLKPQQVMAIGDILVPAVGSAFVTVTPVIGTTVPYTIQAFGLRTEP